MQELEQYFDLIIKDGADKIIISKPVKKSGEFRKIVVEHKAGKYQIAKYTEKQVFHENISEEDIASRCAVITGGFFRQVNGVSGQAEHIILVSKDGKASYKVKRRANDPVKLSAEGAACDIPLKEQDTDSHNRKKNYILQEGMKIEPLTDMGVFTPEGKVVNSMYDKYKQINRFIEILDDEISKSGITGLNVIDFGCGKSYLTFVVYFYLTQIKKIDVNMIGLDLKEDVIKKCNAAASKYGYDRLKFELGDINGFKAPFDVDMVITLHACDTATDFALYNAIMWNAKMIFSVPCCQHELNKQIKPQNLEILSRYGIIKERFSALATDAIRCNLLECRGYKTQILEFIDFDHTPKNLMIRAVKRGATPSSVIKRARGEIETMIDEFGFEPTLYKLLGYDKEKN
ncbi:MAG: SAM-dependent methyltransferase [Butyrivibrio sp.]|nr:SAM-dependent methyltransferase [Butyrivibrio sp.]